MALNYLAAKRAVLAAARGLRVTRTRVNTEAVTAYINSYIAAEESRDTP